VVIALNNALVVMTFMAAGLFVAAWWKGKHVEGIRSAARMFINVLPLLLLAFAMVGFINLLFPSTLLKTWLGEESGWKGLAIGTAIGAVVQGGPFAFFPLFDAVFRNNVSTGTAIAMITAWGMINVGHLPYEFAFLGPRFVALKYSIYIFLPAIAGLLAQAIFG
jgi:uncharacterized membrane protein YraQ (UPF0718 family)